MGISRWLDYELVDAVNGLEVLNGASNRLADQLPLRIGKLGRKFVAQRGQSSDLGWRGIEEGACRADLWGRLACRGGVPESIDIGQADLGHALGVWIVEENVG